MNLNGIIWLNFIWKMPNLLYPAYGSPSSLKTRSPRQTFFSCFSRWNRNLEKKWSRIKKRTASKSLILMDFNFSGWNLKFEKLKSGKIKDFEAVLFWFYFIFALDSDFSEKNKKTPHCMAKKRISIFRFQPFFKF